MPAPSKRTPVRKRKKRDRPVSHRETAALRFAAETFYVNDVVGNISLRDMAEMPAFREVGVKTLETWASHDRWITKRREMQGRLKQNIEERLASQLIQSQLDMLGEMQQIYDRARVYLLSKDGPQPRSFEGVANVVLRLSERMEASRVSMVENLMPRVSREEEDEESATAAAKTDKRRLPDTMLPQVNRDEALAAAHAILRSRQAALPAAPAESGAVEAGTPVGEGADGTEVDA